MTYSLTGNVRFPFYAEPAQLRLMFAFWLSSRDLSEYTPLDWNATVYPMRFASRMVLSGLRATRNRFAATIKAVYSPAVS
jgi:hypothetical protein